MSDFDLYVLKKYLSIPLLVLCIPILWGQTLHCVAANTAAPTLFVSTTTIGGTGNVSPMYWWN
jgi:hypothetical protein